MEETVQVPEIPEQSLLEKAAQQRVELETKNKAGANWFYWIVAWVILLRNSCENPDTYFSGVSSHCQCGIFLSGEMGGG